MKNTVYLGLGSNIGDRANNLKNVFVALSPNMEVVKIFPIYETTPWGYEDQAEFLNQVIECETDLPPNDLLKLVKNIEEELGRIPNFQNGPRIIDIDILFYNDLILENDQLSIPHPRVHQRAFMLVPMKDIAGNYIHPILKESITTLADKIDSAGVHIYKEEINSLTINEHLFEWGKRTYIMGILNITPDSFSGDGLNNGNDSISAALKQAKIFIETGADILDIGGESTRPGSKAVGAEEEINRVIPIIKAISSEFDVPISIDTYKASVAEKALDAGADIINDVWGFQVDPKLGPLAAERDVPVILMHNRSNPKTAEIQASLGGRYIGVEYENLIEDIKNELMVSVEIARKAGVDERNIILDSGIGFGKTVEQNLELLNRSDEIRDLGFPLLVGPSRKSFIGYTLDLPPDQRAEGTAATVAVAIMRGADIVRVHDVEMIAKVAKMTDAIVR
mgnify:FL=1